MEASSHFNIGRIMLENFVAWKMSQKTNETIAIKMPRIFFCNILVSSVRNLIRKISFDF